MHTAYNDSGQVVELIATFFGAPDEGALTVAVEDGPADNCGIDLD